MRIHGLRVPPVAHARAAFPGGNTAPGEDPARDRSVAPGRWCGGTPQHTLSATFPHAAHRGAPHSPPQDTA
jgi:hypothetical protein